MMANSYEIPNARKSGMQVRFGREAHMRDVGRKSAVIAAVG